MKILFLGDPGNPLVRWLRERGETVTVLSEKLHLSQVEKIRPELIVSYNYNFILEKPVFKWPFRGALNLHISFLPWNRGADPNPWSHLEDSPKGVSIHRIDSGIDTGEILWQRSVSFGEKETLRTSYEKLQREVQCLFQENWKQIRRGGNEGFPQPPGGSFHRRSEREKFLSCLGSEGWDVPIDVFKKRFREKERCPVEV